MKPSLKRFGRLLTAAFSVVAIWSFGSLWIGTQPQAFAVAAGGDPIIPISGSGGSYLLSYYDVATAFLPSSGGYGGPRQRDFWLWQQLDRPALWTLDRGQRHCQHAGSRKLRSRTAFSVDLG